MYMLSLTVLYKFSELSKTYETENKHYKEVSFVKKMQIH